MTQNPTLSSQIRIGVISTRLAGTDGVSLETEKWLQMMEEVGIEPYYLTGELDRPAERCHLVPEAHFSHPCICELNEACFGKTERNRATTQAIHQLKDIIKDHLYTFVETFNID